MTETAERGVHTVGGPAGDTAGDSAGVERRWCAAAWSDPTAAGRWRDVDPDLSPEMMHRLSMRGYDADQVVRVSNYVRRHIGAWTQAMLGTERADDEEPAAALARLDLRRRQAVARVLSRT